MIKANELRIGNFVYEGERLVVLHDGFGIDHAHNFSPIPLTEEWLLKFGFEKNGTEFIKETNDTSFIVQYFDYTNSYHFTGGEGIRFGIGVKYIHQVQNLYFALTGEELNIK